MPSMFGKDSKKKELIKNLDSLYAQVLCLTQKYLILCATIMLQFSNNEYNKNVFLFLKLQREHQISPGDFPDIKRMKEQLVHQDFTKFKQLDMRLLQKVRNAFCILSKQR